MKLRTLDKQVMQTLVGFAVQEEKLESSSSCLRMSAAKLRGEGGSLSSSPVASHAIIWNQCCSVVVVVVEVVMVLALAAVLSRQRLGRSHPKIFSLLLWKVCDSFFPSPSANAVIWFSVNSFFSVQRAPRSCPQRQAMNLHLNRTRAEVEV